MRELCRLDYIRVHHKPIRPALTHFPSVSFGAAPFVSPPGHQIPSVSSKLYGPSATQFPARFEVDDVRIYRK